MLLQLGWDVADVVKANSGFLAKYSSAVPWIATAPAIAMLAPGVAVPMLKGVWLAKAAFFSAAPVLPLLR